MYQNNQAAGSDIYNVPQNLEPGLTDYLEGAIVPEIKKCQAQQLRKSRRNVLGMLSIRLYTKIFFSLLWI